ncbi:MAG: serine/threonine protein kinase, partial [Planctomycetes bacterium]|nr:serine/threonine protein kinase [Planctomycetota bacterium]
MVKTWLLDGIEANVEANTHSAGDAGRFDQQTCGECGGGQWVSVADGLVQCGGCGWLGIRARTVDDESQTSVIEEVKAVAPSGVLRGRYRVIREIGRGAHGVSILARHVFLDHPCVLKLLPSAAAGASRTDVQRLRKEARAGFQISDPNVVRVLDCDEIDGVWYFAMEFIDGVSLDRIVDASVEVPWRQAARMACDSAGGLTAIHGAGLVHRDIKPSNLIVGRDGRTRVADLGVAGFASAKPDRSQRVGTLQYMAPEALSAEGAVGAGGDIYSWGATFYHLLTGRLPHERVGPISELLDRQSRPATWPDGMRDDVPAWFRSVIMRCLAIDEAERFQSARALLAELSRNSDQQRSMSESAGASESFEPRGLAVLPFENVTGSRDDDWLG